MSVIRRRLVVCVLAVLLCQLAAMAASEAVWYQAGEQESASSDEIACTCTHGPDAACPMHKSPKAPSPAGASSRESRWCKGCDDGPQMVLAPFTFVGPVVARGSVVAPRGVSALSIAVAAPPLDVVRPPIAPPPRG